MSHSVQQCGVRFIKENLRDIGTDGDQSKNQVENLTSLTRVISISKPTRPVVDASGTQAIYSSMVPIPWRLVKHRPPAIRGVNWTILICICSWVNFGVTPTLTLRVLIRSCTYVGLRKCFSAIEASLLMWNFSDTCIFVHCRSKR
jgi:hypothetical protein